VSKSYLTGTSWVRCALVTALALLTILAAGELTSSLGHAQDPTRTLVLPSATPVPDQGGSTAENVTPPQQTTPVTPTQGVSLGLVVLPFVALLLGLVGGAALLALVAFLLWRARRRRLPSRPQQTASIPFLKSSDDSIYFRLNRLDEGLVIGRGKRGVDLKIPESVPHADTISEQHARIYYDPRCGYVLIEDLGSTNGIYINGRRAPRKNLLKDGWIISLGKLPLTYQDGESDTGPLD